jgi:Bacterial SH3 domain
MAPKTPILIIAGLSGLAAVAGMTSALIQSKSPSPAPTVTASAPAAPAPMKPKAVPIAPQSTESNTPPPSAPAVSSPVPEPPAATKATARDIESCKITMARVDDPNPPLNVRSLPASKDDSTVVGQLKNGTFVTIVDEQPNWFQISTPLKGWIAKANTENTCNQKVERVSFAAGSTSALIADHFIGVGTHTYRLNLGQGQTLTLTSDKGPLPAVIAPNGKFLIGMDEKQETWSGQLPATGDYTIQMESNFKGYKYAFSIKVK